MQVRSLIDFIPLWALFLFVVLLVLVLIESGWRLGQARRRASEHEMEAPVGAMVAATLGLLAFMLAFTFGNAASRYDVRRQLVVEEANAIGTAFLRAGMLPDRNAEIQDLLRTYLDVRLDIVRTGAIEAGVNRSEALHQALWAEATHVVRAAPESIIVGLFVQSLNETIDVHGTRIALAARSRIPRTIWVSLLAVAGFSLGVMGYHVGLSGSPRSLATVAVAVTFATVLLLIADLDRPQAGTLRVSQQSLVDLQRTIGRPTP